MSVRSEFSIEKILFGESDQRDGALTSELPNARHKRGSSFKLPDVDLEFCLVVLKALRLQPHGDRANSNVATSKQIDAGLDRSRIAETKDSSVKIPR